MHHCNQDEAVQMIYIVRRECLGTILLNVSMTAIHFIALENFPLMIKTEFRNKVAQKKGALLKEICG